MPAVLPEDAQVVPLAAALNVQVGGGWHTAIAVAQQRQWLFYLVLSGEDGHPEWWAETEVGGAVLRG